MSRPPPGKSWRFMIDGSLVYDPKSHNWKQLDKLIALSIYTSDNGGFTLLFFFLNQKQEVFTFKFPAFMGLLIK